MNEDNPHWTMVGPVRQLPRGRYEEYSPYSYSHPSWQEQHDDEQRALAQCLFEERTRKTTQGRVLSQLESELRAAVGITFDLTTDAKDRMSVQRNEYVSAAIKELKGKPAEAWEKQLEQSRSTLQKVEQQVAALQVELKARLARRFWCVEVTTVQREAVRRHFRQRAPHGKDAALYKMLQHSAESYVAHEFVAGSMYELQRAVGALEQYKYARHGEQCPICKKGTLVDRKRALDGGVFVGCSRYPDCRHAWGIELGTTSSGAESTDSSVQVAGVAITQAMTAIEAEHETRRQVETMTAPCTDVVDGVTTTEKETEKQMAESKTESKNIASVGGIASYLVEMTKDDTKDAAWRSSADRAVDILKEPAKIALRKFRTGYMAPVAKFALTAIDHPIGEGIFSWCAGVTIVGYGPLRNNMLGPRTMRLSKELRVKGIKPITDLVSKTILDPVRKTIVALVETLPEDAIGTV